MNWQPLKEDTHLLVLNDKKLAIVWGITGHVERPDSFYVKFNDLYLNEITGERGFSSLNDAKYYAEKLVIEGS